MWAKQKYTTKKGILTRCPLKARLIKLDYSKLETIFDMTKPQLQGCLRFLERDRLITRQKIKNVWYVFISDKLIDLCLIDTEHKGKLDKGDVILHDWFKIIKTKAGNTHFEAICLMGHIIYWSRFFEVTNPDNNQKEIVSKSKGLAPFFEYKDLAQKFKLTRDRLDNALETLISNNLLKIDTVRTTTGRKTTIVNGVKTTSKRRVIKKNYFIANFEKLTKNSNLNFKFKGDLYQNDSTDPFDSPSSSSLDETIKKPKKLKINRRFKTPKSLDQMTGYLKSFTLPTYNKICYPMNFLKLLLNKLAAKYPHHTFVNKQKFINYFSGILKKEYRHPIQVNNKTYFDKALSFKDFIDSKLLTFQDKLASWFSNTWDNAKTILFKLASKNVSATFNCLEGIASYLAKALNSEKSASEINDAFSALPKAGLKQIEKYLTAVEGSYRSEVNSMEGHLRRRIAARVLDKRIAYNLLNLLYTWNLKVSGHNLVLPTTNAVYCQLLPKHIKQTIINEARSIFGNYIQSISFLQIQKKPNTNYIKNVARKPAQSTQHIPTPAPNPPPKQKVSGNEFENLFDKKMQSLAAALERYKNYTNVYIPSPDDIRADLYQLYEVII